MRRLVALLLVTLLLLAACGGNPPESEQPSEAPTTTGSTDPQTEPSSPETTTPESSESEGKESADVELANLESFKELGDIVARFSRLQYEFSSPEGSAVITIQMLGEDTVGGETTDHIVIDMKENDSETEQVELWIDGDGQTIKLVVDGEELGKEMATMMGNAILMGMFWPFLLTDELDMATALEEETDPRFDVSEVRREERRYGSLDADVYIYEVDVNDEGETLNYKMEVADLGAFQMFAGWELSLADAAGTENSTFRVLELELR